MRISLQTLVDIHARAQAVKAGKSQALKRQERHVMLALESCASSSLFSSFMSDLKKGDEAYLGRAEARCRVEHLGCRKESKRQRRMMSAAMNSEIILL